MTPNLISKRVLVVHPSGSQHYAPHREAVSMITEGHATWADERHKQINVLPKQMRVRGKLQVRDLSAKYGADLAERYRNREAIAEVIVAHIRLERTAPSYGSAA